MSGPAQTLVLLCVSVTYTGFVLAWPSLSTYLNGNIAAHFNLKICKETAPPLGHVLSWCFSVGGITADGIALVRNLPVLPSGRTTT